MDLPLAAGSQQVVRRPSGELLLIDDAYRVPPTLVDSFGRSRELTRSGSGPGEWRRPAAAWPSHPDSFSIYDRQLLRVTSYDWTGRPGPSVHVPFATNGVTLSPGRMLLTAQSGTRETIGRSYFVYEWGGFLRTWPEADTRHVPGVSNERKRLLARGDSEVWSVQVNRAPVLEHRDLQGRLIQTVRLDVPWYWSPTRGARIDPRAPNRPASFARGIAIRDSTLVVLFEAAAPDWKRHMMLVDGPEGASYIERSTTGALDSWVVILHARTGVVVAIQKFDAIWHGLTNDADLVRVRIEQDQTMLELHRIVLPPSTTR